MDLFKRLQGMYLDGKITWDEWTCIIQSIHVHADLPQATVKCGTDSYQYAKRLVKGDEPWLYDNDEDKTKVYNKVHQDLASV